jgi:type I restriction enzyme, S subunit
MRWGYATKEGVRKMKTWPIQTFREAGISLIDCEHKTPHPSDKGYPYIAIPQLKHGRIDLTDTRIISHKDFGEWTKR